MSKQATHTPTKCRCLSCINAELLGALKAIELRVELFRHQLSRELSLDQLVRLDAIAGECRAAIAHAERKEQAQ